MSVESPAIAPDAAVAQPAGRWGQLIVGVLCMVMIANLQYGWTLFVNPIDQKYHWGAAAIQLAFSVFIATETWLVPVEGWFVDRFGPRVVVACGGAIVAFAWTLDAIGGSLSLLYVAGALSGVGAGAVYGTCVGNALKWFSDRRGLAAGLTAAGFGAGAAITVVPIANMIQSSGYQHAFFFFGIFQGAAIFLIALFMTKPKPPKGVVPQPRLVTTKVDYTLSQMLGTPVFWLTYIIY